MTGSAKCWIFTWNNYTPDDEQYLRQVFESGKPRRLLYLVYGRENAPTTGTPHLQGYLVLAKRTTRAAVCRLLRSKCRLDIARGTAVRNREYCSKDREFEEFGDIPTTQGRRTDLAELAQRITEGASPEEIFTEFPAQWLRYRHNILATIRERGIRRNWVTECFIYWGKTRTGKTRAVWDAYPHDDIWVHGGDPKFFDGYSGQPIVLFDDFDGSYFKIHYLLKLTDRYRMMVQVKGGWVQWAPKKIFFTSNKDPQIWYENAHPEHVAAFFERVTEIKEFE